MHPDPIQNKTAKRTEEHLPDLDLVVLSPEQLLRPMPDRLSQTAGRGHHEKRGEAEHHDQKEKGKQRGRRIAEKILNPLPDCRHDSTRPSQHITRAFGKWACHHPTFRIEGILVKPQRMGPLVESERSPSTRPPPSLSSLIFQLLPLPTVLRKRYRPVGATTASQSSGLVPASLVDGTCLPASGAAPLGLRLRRSLPRLFPQAWFILHLSSFIIPHFPTPPPPCHYINE